MASRKARWQPGRRVFPLNAGAAGLALAVALGGCSPIDAYRSAIGVAKNDPDPATAPFGTNMKAADAAPYPNLASVPPPPTRETTAAERQNLTQSLLADRAAAQAAAGPMPPALAAAATPSTTTAEAHSGALRPAAQASASGRGKAEAPLAPRPLESNLQTPQISSAPQPETPRPSPPRPALPAIASPAPVAAPPPATIASAMPQPAPPVPELAPIVAPPPPTAGTAPGGMPAATTVATLDMPGLPGDADRAQVARVAALYRQRPGNLRIIAYAAPPNAGGDPLAGYHLALDRAQAVATALARAGIPAGKIQTQAAPAAGAHIAGRVDIQLAP